MGCHQSKICETTVRRHDIASKKFDDNNDDTSIQSEWKREDDKLIEALPKKKAVDYPTDLFSHCLSRHLTGRQANFEEEKVYLVAPRSSDSLLLELEKFEKRIIEYNQNMKYDKKYDLITFDRCLENIETYARIGFLECEDLISKYRKFLEQQEGTLRNNGSHKADAEGESRIIKRMKEELPHIPKIIQDLTKNKIEFRIADMKAKSLQLIIHEIIDPTLANNPKHTTHTDKSKKRWLKSSTLVNRRKPYSMNKYGSPYFNRRPRFGTIYNPMCYE